MKLPVYGGAVAIFMLAACGQTGPLVLPPKVVEPAPQEQQPVAVVPPFAALSAPAPGLGKALEAPAKAKQEKK